MTVTFGQATELVAAAWPDYEIAPYGYDGGEDWLVLLLPEMIGGRIATVDKATGEINWINENDDEYVQDQPVGDWPAQRS